MKSCIKRRVLVWAIVLVGMVEAANAFYDSGLQRWINRDPMTSLDHNLEGKFDLHAFDFIENAPISSVDSSGLFTWHGNWGGSHWTAGCEGTWEQVVDQKSAQNEAIDNQDKCYEIHDKCHAACRDEFRAAPPEKWQSAKIQLGRCLRQCDSDCSKCLGKLAKDDPSNGCKAKLTKAAFCVLGKVGHIVEPNPPSRSKCNGN